MKKGWIVVVLFLWLIMASASSMHAAAIVPVGAQVAQPSSKVPANQSKSPQSQKPKQVAAQPSAPAVPKSAVVAKAPKAPKPAVVAKAAQATKPVVVAKVPPVHPAEVNKKEEPEEEETADAPAPENSEFQQAAAAGAPSIDDLKDLVPGKIVDDKKAAREELLENAAGESNFTDKIKSFSIVDQLKVQITKIKGSFNKMLNIGAQIPDAYKAASYFADSSIRVQEPDSGALVINLGYGGAGDIRTGFLGAKSQLDIPLVPDFLIKPVMTGFAKFSREVGVNRFIIITPSDECLSKLILLGCSKLSKKVSESEFIKEFHLLLARLYKTPSAKGLKALGEDVPPILKELAQELEIAEQPFSNLFEWYGFEFEKMLNNDFAKPPVLPVGDYSAVIHYALTILLHGTLDYQAQKAAYLKSPEGKAANELLGKNIVAAGNNDKTLAYVAFNTSMPGFSKIKQDVISRLAPFIKTPFFIKLKEKIGVVIHSFIEELGIAQSDFDSFSGAAIELSVSEEVADSLEDATAEGLVFVHAAVDEDSEENSDDEDQAAGDDASTSDSAGDDSGDAASQDGEEAAEDTSAEDSTQDAEDPAGVEETEASQGGEEAAGDASAEDTSVEDSTQDAEDPAEPAAEEEEALAESEKEAEADAEDLDEVAAEEEDGVPDEPADGAIEAPAPVIDASKVVAAPAPQAHVKDSTKLVVASAKSGAVKSAPQDTLAKKPDAEKAAVKASVVQPAKSMDKPPQTPTVKAPVMAEPVEEDTPEESATDDATELKTGEEDAAGDAPEDIESAESDPTEPAAGEADAAEDAPAEDDAVEDDAVEDDAVDEAS